MTAGVPTNKEKRNFPDPIITGILNNDQKVIRLIYKNQYGKIKNMVHNFQNLNIDAEDVFQEGLTRAIINVRKGIFKGDSAFSTYLYSICNNICLKEYHRNKRINTSEVAHIGSEQEEDNFELLSLVIQVKNDMDENCRKIIELRFGLNEDTKNLRFENIAQILGLKPANARQRFGRCFAKLLEKLQQNKEFKLLTR